MEIFLCEPVGPFAIAARVTNTFTTKQDVTPAPVPVIPGGRLRPGTKIALKAIGDFNTTATPNLTMGFWYGTRALAITGDLALSSVIVAPTATLWPWSMEWEGMCTVGGAAGAVVGNGQLQLGASLTTFAAEVPIPITAALRTVSIDLSIERALGVSATWSASSASNQITVNSFRAVLWN